MFQKRLSWRRMGNDSCEIDILARHPRNGIFFPFSLSSANQSSAHHLFLGGTWRTEELSLLSRVGERWWIENQETQSTLFFGSLARSRTCNPRGKSFLSSNVCNLLDDATRSRIELDQCLRLQKIELFGRLLRRLSSSHALETWSKCRRGAVPRFDNPIFCPLLPGSYFFVI